MIIDAMEILTRKNVDDQIMLLEKECFYDGESNVECAISIMSSFSLMGLVSLVYKYD
jgi:hypothetical protein